MERAPQAASGMTSHSQRQRIDFLIQRDGVAAARVWALGAVQQYRRAVLDRTRYTMYRRPFIEAYCQLKRFALTGMLP